MKRSLSLGKSILLLLITTGQVLVERDWISSPKSTGYEALHITVMGPKGGG
jgi:ppGpp synthetase/RelA/SpoT-type nucleotidyltranferase